MSPTRNRRGGVADSGLEEASARSRIISTPDLLGCAPVTLTEESARVGGRQLAPPITLITSLSWRGDYIQLREEWRRRPDEPWGITSDSARKIVDPSLTGNEPLPGTHWAYRIAMNYADKAYQRPKRGGLAARNWLRLECRPKDG